VHSLVYKCGVPACTNHWLLLWAKVLHSCFYTDVLGSVTVHVCMCEDTLITIFLIPTDIGAQNSQNSVTHPSD